MAIAIGQHNVEIQENLEAWKRKPLLRKIYNDFYTEILKYLRKDLSGQVVEIGSGIGNFKDVYPECVATDIFPNPWIDRVESAYKMSFADNSLSNLILFDVFHHLKYPGSALKEFQRVLRSGGRVIVFEPCISLLGMLVYGIFHHEPVAYFDKINWEAEEGLDPDGAYYAAQGNATRIFREGEIERLKDWKILKIKKFSAISYVLSGGFSKPSFYPDNLLPMLKNIEKILDSLPAIFATRMLVVLEKK